MRGNREGPYGPGNDLKHYSSLLFVIGGNGVTVALSHLCDIFHTATKGETFCLRSLRITWVIRDIALFHDIYARELEPWLSSPQLRDSILLEVDIYITGHHDSSPTTPATLSSTIKDEFTVSTAVKDRFSEAHSSRISFAELNINFFRYRPSVRDTITKFAENNNDGGNKAVMTCGPARMTDEARAAVVTMLGRGFDTLDFYPERFSW